jgi:hypothetical protein
VGWLAIISALLTIFGPLIADWLKGCLEERLNEAAASLPPAETYASEGDASDALFDEAIRGLPRFAFARRAALRRAKAAAREGDGIRTAPLTAAELDEARDLVGAVKNEI